MVEPSLDCVNIKSKQDDNFADCYCKNPSDITAKFKLTDNEVNDYNRYCNLSKYDFGKDEYCKTQSPENLDYSCYCKYPDAYKNSTFGLTQKQIDSMDKYCQEIEQSIATKGPESFGDFLVQEGKYGLSEIELKLSQIFTPEGLWNLIELTGITELSKLGLNVFKNLSMKALRSIATSLENMDTEMVSRIFSEVGDIFADTLLDGIVSYTLAIATEQLSSFIAVAALAAEFAATGIGLVVDVALAVFSVVMMAGMVLDMLDPYGFNNALSAKDLVAISNAFNKVFQNVMFSSINFPEGNEYPVEYYADLVLLPNFKFSQKIQDQFNVLGIFYTTQYLDSLIYNSRGEYIYRGDNKLNANNFLGNIPNINANLLSINNSLINVLGNGNMRVKGFIINNWLPLSIVAILVILLLIFFPFKKRVS